MPNATNQTRFSWLHFSDWHLSFNDVSYDDAFYWSRLKFDLAQRHEESGDFDAVFVTGDLTSSGSHDEYEAFAYWLNELMAYLYQLGSSPVVLFVPGNHDAVRTNRSEARLLRYFSEDASLRDDFWGEKRSDYHPVIEQSFANYLNWSEKLSGKYDSASNNITDKKNGLFPGDFSATLKTNGLKIGVVGFNTAAIQLSEGDFKGRLLLDPRQMESVCGSDPDKWARNHDISILLTHHPSTWLEPESQMAFKAEIAPPGRFALHLCGSLHEESQVVRLQESAALLIQSPPIKPGQRIAPGYIAGYLEAEEGLEALMLRPRRYDGGRETFVNDIDYDPSLIDEYLRDFERANVHRHYDVAKSTAITKDVPLVIERLELKNFRGFERLSLDFRSDASLPGQWTCLAGINGAGKSSILQALCLILLGDPFIFELGIERLNRTRRFKDGQQYDAEVKGWVNDGKTRNHLEIKLTSEPPPVSANTESYRQVMLDFWKKMRSQVFLAYGATRNLSDYHDTRYSSLSPDVRRLMTVFDPLTQITSAEVLLAEHRPTGSPLLSLFGMLLKDVFGGSIGLSFRDDRVVFTGDGGTVGALDLPDGFRSSVAWLVDLCAVWCEKFPERAHNSTPADIEAIVLIDEIDLHLHPSLQRVLVPRLRKALPHVQWIVTTHSPLILSSFDSAEIIALDKTEPGGVRFLDRQILGFTTDQIYNWLMQTPATGAVLEQKLEGDPSALVPSDEELAQLIEVSPDVTEEEARDRLRKRRELINQLDSLNL